MTRRKIRSIVCFCFLCAAEVLVIFGIIAAFMFVWPILVLLFGGSQ